MRAKDFLIDGNLPARITWAETARIPDIEIRCEVLASHLDDDYSLYESNAPATVDYLLNLPTTEPVMDNTFIFSFMALVNDKIAINECGIGTIIAIGDNEITFRMKDGSVSTYPDKLTVNKMPVRTFLFTTLNEYNKFRTLIQLRFGVGLPDIIEEGYYQ